MRVATRLAFQAGTVSAWAWSHSSGSRWCRSSASAINVEAEAGEHPSATASGSGVNAATAGVPVVGIAGSEKVRAFLTALGVDRQIVSPWVASSTMLHDALDRALGDAALLGDDIRAGVVRQRAAAARNPIIAAELVAGRRAG